MMCVAEAGDHLPSTLVVPINAQVYRQQQRSNDWMGDLVVVALVIIFLPVTFLIIVICYLYILVETRRKQVRKRGISLST